jgi:hypothetical protein
MATINAGFLETLHDRLNITSWHTMAHNGTQT